MPSSSALPVGLLLLEVLRDNCSLFSLSHATTAVDVQVVKLGSAVTGVQLSPGQDLLATCHVKRRGIYLWYNNLMFGSGAEPSTRPVNAALPSIASGQLPVLGITLQPIQSLAWAKQTNAV